LQAGNDRRCNDDAAKPHGDIVIAHLARFAPDLPDSTIARRVRTPVDLETRYGLPGKYAADTILSGS
jgi:phytoene dehydrogenase-like protein